jgi:hypothetical protein
MTGRMQGLLVRDEHGKHEKLKKGLDTVRLKERVLEDLCAAVQVEERLMRSGRLLRIAASLCQCHIEVTGQPELPASFLGVQVPCQLYDKKSDLPVRTKAACAPVDPPARAKRCSCSLDDY